MVRSYVLYIFGECYDISTAIVAVHAIGKLTMYPYCNVTHLFQVTLVGHIHGASGTIPIFHQPGTPGVFQAIPISIVPAGAKPITAR